MAENEYLDSTKARRWRAVAEGLRDECDSEELTERVKNQFYKTIRRIQKDLPQFADMLAAIDKPDVLQGICNQMIGAADVKDAILEAAFEGTGRDVKIEHFLGRALEGCLYDIPYTAAEIGDGGNMSDHRRRLDGVRVDLGSDIHRMAMNFAAKPSWIPRMSPGSRSLVSVSDKTDVMLSESLIQGFRK